MIERALDLFVEKVAVAPSARQLESAHELLVVDCCSGRLRPWAMFRIVSELAPISVQLLAVEDIEPEWDPGSGTLVWLIVDRQTDLAFVEILARDLAIRTQNSTELITAGDVEGVDAVLALAVHHLGGGPRWRRARDSRAGAELAASALMTDLVPVDG